MHVCNTQLIGIELSLYIIDKVAHWLTVALIFFSWALLCINYFFFLKQPYVRTYEAWE